jgi:hypothetical protein
MAAQPKAKGGELYRGDKLVPVGLSKNPTGEQPIPLAAAGTDKNLAHRASASRASWGVEFNGLMCYRARWGFWGFAHGACYPLARVLLQFAKMGNSRYATVA